MYYKDSIIEPNDDLSFKELEDVILITPIKFKGTNDIGELFNEDINYNILLPDLRKKYQTVIRENNKKEKRLNKNHIRDKIYNYNDNEIKIMIEANLSKLQISRLLNLPLKIIKRKIKNFKDKNLIKSNSKITKKILEELDDFILNFENSTLFMKEIKIKFEENYQRKFNKKIDFSISSYRKYIINKKFLNYSYKKIPKKQLYFAHLPAEEENRKKFLKVLLNAYNDDYLLIFVGKLYNKLIFEINNR